MLERGKINIGFIDGQWGSSGKGKFNAYLATTEEIDFAISQNSVNASHIVQWDDGREYKFQHLPTSVINPDIRCMIGAGASIDMKQLLKEIDDWNLTERRLQIHPNAVIITEDDIAYEKEHLVGIASTMTGNGAAAGRKVMRHPNVKTASDMKELKHFMSDITSTVAAGLQQGKTGLIETAQGFDLSIDHGGLCPGFNGVAKAYPYTTSRNVDPLTFAGMSGIPSRMIGSILLNLRTFPIRVGDGSNNKVDGYSGVDLKDSNSGPCWPDQHELDWKTDIGVDPEITSLTKRKRRVFSFSRMQLQHITKIVQPTHITLNFVNYVDPNIYKQKSVISRERLACDYPHVRNFVNLIEGSQYWAGTIYEAKVKWLGTGPSMSDLVELV